MKKIIKTRKSFQIGQYSLVWCSNLLYKSKKHIINNFKYIKPLLPVATQERIPLEPTSAARTIKKYLEIKKNVNYNKKKYQKFEDLYNSSLNTKCITFQ